MFFLVERKANVLLHPKYFGKNMAKQVLSQLKAQLEGTSCGRFGFTLLVTSIVKMGDFHLEDDGGYAHIPVTYLSMVFRPFPNEVVWAIVTAINSSGIFAQVGPLEVFISRALMPAGSQFQEGKNGQHIFYSREEDITIEMNLAIRVKLIGMRMATNKIVLVGSIREDYLLA